MQDLGANWLGSIPSPETGVWNLGPIPIRAYALCILTGIVLAYWVTSKRYAARGGNPSLIADMALWGIPFGIVGARLYHVMTDWPVYFGPGGSGIGGAVQIWSGGIGIWGAAAGGMLGIWIASSAFSMPSFICACIATLALFRPFIACAASFCWRNLAPNSFAIFSQLPSMSR